MLAHSSTPESWQAHAAQVVKSIAASPRTSNGRGSSQIQDDDERHLVFARVRPLLPSDYQKRPDLYDCVTVTDSSITVHSGSSRLNVASILHSTFDMDAAFGQDANDDDIYEAVRSTLLRPVPTLTMPVPVGDATLFLYGKTGTGKSHTMAGIANRFAREVFQVADAACPIVGVSAVEIVAGTKGFTVSRDFILDLLKKSGDRRVDFRDDAAGTMHLQGALEKPVGTFTEMAAIFDEARTARRTQANARNSESSRSHLIYFLRFRKAAARANAGSCQTPQLGRVLSTLTLVDLAGNEYGRDTLTYKGNSDLVTDSIAINRSLSALKDCIRAAATGNPVQFRGSTLTRVLKKCFVDPACRTIFVGTLSGDPRDANHARQTLKYMGLIKWRTDEFMREKVETVGAQPSARRKSNARRVG
ncbi:hypothetical protein HKX48_002545 [Thoreauomyces humboldtii]|nr:hypothetical protein HKX48_002545 [Thoreauomyces humboldtii]